MALRKTKPSKQQQESAFLASAVGRHNAIADLIRAAENVCKKLEHPTASVDIRDQYALRHALDAVRR